MTEQSQPLIHSGFNRNDSRVLYGAPKIDSVCYFNELLDGLSRIAAQLVKSRESSREKDWRRIPNGKRNLPLHGSNLARHDILLIVDETNSLASQMEKIKQTLDDVVAEFDGAMDFTS